MKVAGRNGKLLSKQSNLPPTVTPTWTNFENASYTQWPQPLPHTTTNPSSIVPQAHTHMHHNINTSNSVQTRTRANLVQKYCRVTHSHLYSTLAPQ
ncbi:hypothetical protein BDR07DRAFT_1410304 [Suillus spraguei]|nr:hypothetical protein BDR07DRAFT_1438850 [Suillus spraguei]KAG2361183.1 hypothetical protein BDR07DRAFT_1410304 [Suillus spraguei]